MAVRKVIKKRVNRSSGGISIAGGVDAVVTANVGEAGSVSMTSSVSRISAVQGNRRAQPDPGPPRPTEGKNPTSQHPDE